jgi:uncharacterized protein YndB with AHSA1/START domain
MTVTTPLGQVLRDEDGMRLEFIRSYDGPMSDVWSALTDPDRTARWFGRWTGDPASGSVHLVMVAEPDAQPQTVTIVACEPPSRLIVETAGPDGPWRLEVTLTDQNAKTTLRFVQRLAEPYDASSIGPGWHFYLDRLAAVVHGYAMPEDFESYYPALQDDYAPP